MSRLNMSLDFSLSRYSDICGAVLACGRPIMTAADFLDSKPRPRSAVILRHDVDRQPASAVIMARLEHSAGIRASYYFRAGLSRRLAGRLAEMESLRHEVGYHYETLAHSGGNRDDALVAFERELEAMRKVARVRTVSAHGSPLSAHDNASLLRPDDLRRFGLSGQATDCVNGQLGYYFTDTGRRWDAESSNLRDRVDSLAPAVAVRTTNDLIAFLVATSQSVVMISAHPNRWPAGPVGWISSWVIDQMANSGKTALRPFRRGRRVST